MQPKRRALLLSLCLLILIAGLSTIWLTAVAIQRERRNQALIVTLMRLTPDSKAAEVRQAALAVQTLLVAGADPNARDQESEQLSFWQQLVALFHRRPHTVEGNTPLLFAVQMWPPDSSKQTDPIYAYRSQIVQLLLTHGADVNAKDRAGATALIWAAEFGHREVIQILLAHGADLNAKDSNGRTALIWAAVQGKTEVIQLLLAHGVDLNAKDSHGSTALTEAAELGHSEVVQSLLAHGADVNAKDSDSNTALIWMAGQGKTEVVQSLLKHGADVNAKDSHGQTALILATQAKYSDIVSLLKRAGAKE